MICNNAMHLKLFSFLLLIFGVNASLGAQAIPVKVVQTEAGQWQLLRDGQPYFIQGAGGHTNLDELQAIGGNSFRTWSTDNALEILDEAHRRGFTVMMGLWVQHERHGFDYDNEAAVAKQLANFRAVVTQLKDHPALLMWSVGNEVDLQYTNTKVWYAVNDIAKMIHEVDPNHPTCTVTAGLDEAEVKLIQERAPHIDIYGINTYGDLLSVKANLRKFGWNGPYIITEWGPNGHWEVAKTSWGAPIEQSSHEKAESYKSRYEQGILADLNYCLGSYVFLWGFKQETTSTWYGLFLDSGESSPAVDELARFWTGDYPMNRAPILTGAKLDSRPKGSEVILTADDSYEAQVACTDPDGDSIKYKWEILRESTDIKSGGDAEKRPEGMTGLIQRRKKNTVRFRAPREEGPYRLFIYAFDGQGHVAYLNIPFYVSPRPADSEQSRFIQFRAIEMDSFTP